MTGWDSEEGFNWERTMFNNCTFDTKPKMLIDLEGIGLKMVWVGPAKIVGCYGEMAVNTGDEVTLVGVNCSGLFVKLAKGVYFGAIDADDVTASLDGLSVEQVAHVSAVLHGLETKDQGDKP